MQFLINKIDELNLQLSTGLKDSFKFYGLTKSTTRNKEMQNFEVSTTKQVIIDDTYKSFFYHKLNDIKFNKLQERGKKYIYNATASFSLICYSDQINFDEDIIRGLGIANIEKCNLLVEDINFDSNKIISEETAKKDFDFNKFLFVVNYQLLYMTDNCIEACQ